MLHPKALRTGSKHTAPNGYVHIRCPQHPNASKAGTVLEHRLVMERHLGRFLTRAEAVHHKNGKRGHNRIGNLQLFATQGDHLRHHRPPKRCGICGEFHNPGGQAMTHCSKCGKVIRVTGRNHFPAICWRCRFPVQKCKVCGGKHEAHGFCENHYKQWQRKQRPPQPPRFKHGVDHHANKYTEAQILHVKRLLLTDMMQKDITKATGVPKVNVSQIHRGISWAHLKLPVA